MDPNPLLERRTEPDSPSGADSPTGSDALPDGEPYRKQVTDAERAIVSRCLKAVEKRANYLQEKGLTKGNFIFGVSNSLFVAWSFGAIPEHFWIVYLVEIVVLFPLRWQHQVQARPLRQDLYWLDFCWIANFTGFSVLILLVVDAQVPSDFLNDEMRLRMFSACWGIGCGPLLLATGLLGNALLFHDADNVASVLIHLFPSLVLYVLGWHYDLVQAAWPRTFRLDYLNRVRPWADIYLTSAMAYTIWLLLYTLWLLCCGMTQPEKGYDTIFHANMRGVCGRMAAKVMRHSKEDHADMARKNSFPKSYALLYMVGHGLAVYVAILASLLCFANKYIHCGICGLMTFMTVSNGASRYTYYMVHSYGQVLRQELGIPLNRKGSALRSL